MNSCCMVVIGHVDHGKTALVRALTGIETDRLAEEKARGLSITAGFAHHSYPNGVVDFVDAPGHADFIQAMITGATGARAALVVISAVEGIAAQTLEHLEVAELLGIKQGVIAVTKSDMLAAPQQEARQGEIRQGLAQTAFADAPLVLCSAQSGTGIDTLHAMIEALIDHPATSAAPLDSYLPIDRVFSLSGLGTIVTGTLQGRDLHLGDRVTLQPDGQPVTLRSLQSRGETRDHIRAGERVAANLRGVAVAEVPRGAVLCARDVARPSTFVDVYFPPDRKQPLKHMQELRVFLGTRSAVASLRLFGGGQLGVAQPGFAQLRFKAPVVGYSGQRMVLRRLSPAETIGGAVVLDPQAVPCKSRDAARVQILQAALAGDAKEIARTLCSAGQGICAPSDIARLSRLAPVDVERVLGSSFIRLTADAIAPQAALEASKESILSALAGYHQSYPLRRFAPQQDVLPRKMAPVLCRFALDALQTGQQVRQRNGEIATFDHDPLARLDDTLRARMAEVEITITQAALTGPSEIAADETDTDLLALLIDVGLVLGLQNVALKQRLLFHGDALRKAADDLRQIFPARQGFTTGEARSALGTSRRVIVPVLEYFDSIGITVRCGNLRRMTAKTVPPADTQG